MTPPYEILRLDVVDSTNTRLKELAKDGAKAGTVLVANRQTAGRGRLGRTFVSPASGLYCSILLRPAFVVSPAALTCLAAAALWETAEAFGVSASIKWVNDLYRNGKKAAGILTEGAAQSDGRFAYAIVGVGVNLFTPESGFPTELQDSVTALFAGDVDETLREAFLSAFLAHFFAHYDALPHIDFFETYRKNLNVYGRRVAFSDAGHDAMGVACDLDDSFRLVVRLADGTTRPLSRGEVTFCD